MNATVSGGGPVSAKVLEEVHVMSGHIVLVFLVLVCAFTSRIPDIFLSKFKSVMYKFSALFIIILLTSMYGWVHGILATLAFALVVSRAYRHTESQDSSEGFTKYEPDIFTTETTLIDSSHKWLVEEILGYTPIAIRDKEINTTAVQDMSEKNMGNTRSSK